jgi:hypothetical protein
LAQYGVRGRVATRCEMHAANPLAMIVMAAVLLWP